MQTKGSELFVRLYISSALRLGSLFQGLHTEWKSKPFLQVLCISLTSGSRTLLLSQDLTHDYKKVSGKVVQKFSLGLKTACIWKRALFPLFQHSETLIDSGYMEVCQNIFGKMINQSNNHNYSVFISACTAHTVVVHRGYIQLTVE